MNPTAAPSTKRELPPPSAIEMDSTAYDVFQRIGIITRRLHDALHELGYDKALENAVDSLPDARARLSYIAKLTGESANKVLNTVEFARATQDEMSESALALKARWKGKTAQSLACAEGEALVTDTNEFLGSLSMSTDLTNSHLTDIMMAQDFHDLTGQVIRKVVDLAQTLEEQLLALLLETTPPEQRAKLINNDIGFLNGPAVQTEGRNDIVTSQSQVDEMLESLGF
ncbi:MAG: protein phosphatase CheZ [Usitatibacteraceae bacterium]